MNKVILLIIAIVIIGAIFFIGGIPEGGKAPQQQLASTACVDYNPPDFSQGVTLPSTGTQYGLLKQKVEVNAAKFGEMQRIDSINGNDVYVLSNVGNYFGDSGSFTQGDSVIYVLIDRKPGEYYFDLYMKQGVAIPDYILNCKSLGGKSTSVLSQNGDFPPPAFNKTDIINLKDESLTDGYVYDGSKVSFNSIKNLTGLVTVGSVNVKSKTQTYPLYNHLGTLYLVDNQDAYEYLPTDNPVNFDKNTNNNQLQLQTLTFVNTPQISWWTPDCKPAIYLYPPKQETVKVQVTPEGSFTYTNPTYPSGGWEVTASPDGTLYTTSSGMLPSSFYNIAADVVGTETLQAFGMDGLQKYSYLYYEAKIPNNDIQVPTTGYVVAYDRLPSLFDQLLPKLGLQGKEITEFKQYWSNALVRSPYYFVGVMNEKALQTIEPLEITPHPDTLIRVRLYFEPLMQKKTVQAPTITTPRRTGFTVAEWGGMVKMNDGSEFTCSQ